MPNNTAKWADGELRWVQTDNLAEEIPAAPPMLLYDDFNHPVIDTTNDWTFAAVNSGTVAYNAQAGGVARITTGAADDDDAELASALVFKAALGCCVEIRCAQNDADGTAFCVGFSDATGEAADKIALTFASASFTSNASDAACFVYDPDYAATSAYVQLCGVKGDTDATPVASAITPADGVYHTYRVEIDSAGNIKGYADGVLVGTLSAAITTTTALCAYVGVINREGAANTFDIDYIRAWNVTRS